MTQAINTPADAQVAFRSLAKEISSEADIYVSLSLSRWGRQPDPLTASVYPRGIDKEAAFTVEASDWSALLLATKDKWVEHSDEHAARTVRAMALAIIRITADLGECTDAALRQEFSDTEVRRHGKRACEEANDIAGRGPFSIVSFGGANGEEAA